MVGICNSGSPSGFQALEYYEGPTGNSLFAWITVVVQFVNSQYYDTYSDHGSTQVSCSACPAGMGSAAGATACK